MYSSEIRELLQGGSEWKDFCEKYKDEKIASLSRNDGASTSGDLGLIFDASHVTVTSEQIHKLCDVIMKNEVDLCEGQFLASVVALSGFDYDRDQTEDAVLFLSSELDDLSKVQEALELLDL